MTTSLAAIELSPLTMFLHSDSVSNTHINHRKVQNKKNEKLRTDTQGENGKDGITTLNRMAARIA
jgi:hypothetical protein